MTLDLLITATNASLKARGIRLVVEQRKDSVYLRGTWTDSAGIRKRQRLPLGIAATPKGVTEADAAAAKAWVAITAGIDPVSVVLPALKAGPGNDGPNRSIVAEVVDRFERDFWSTRAKTAAAEQTWQRIRNELQRLPAQAMLTIDLLEATASAKTEPDTRSRLEACKVYKRLAVFAEIGETTRLDRLRGTYEPEERELPSDEQLIAFLDEVRESKWGWVMCAAATFGVRPAEVPSLVLNGDGTASAITLKRHGRKPTLRTCMALPGSWVERWNLQNVDIPGEARWVRPEQYSSNEGRRWVSAWRHGLRTKKLQALLQEHMADGFDNVTLRHCWAVRSIKAGLPVSLAAKAMGHAIQVHERQYHRWLQATDLREAMARLAL